MPRGHSARSMATPAAARRQMQELRAQVSSLKQKVRRRDEGSALRGLLDAPPPSDIVIPGARAYELEASDVCTDADASYLSTGSPPRDAAASPASVKDLVGSSHAAGGAAPSTAGDTSLYRDIASYQMKHDSMRRAQHAAGAAEAARLAAVAMHESPRRPPRTHLGDAPVPFCAFNASGKSLRALDPKEAWAEGTPEKAATTTANAMTQVNSSSQAGVPEDVCGSGRYQTHRVRGGGVMTSRASERDSVALATDYCVHATTTTRPEVPGYALPTWSSWPAASRLAPCEVDGGRTKKLQRRSARRTRSRSPRRQQQGGDRFPSYPPYDFSQSRSNSPAQPGAPSPPRSAPPDAEDETYALNSIPNTTAQEEDVDESGAVPPEAAVGRADPRGEVVWDAEMGWVMRIGGVRAGGRQPSRSPLRRNGGVKGARWEQLYDDGMYSKQQKLQKEIDRMYERRAAEEAAAQRFKPVPKVRDPQNNIFDKLYYQPLQRPAPSPMADYHPRRAIDPYLRNDPPPKSLRPRPNWRCVNQRDGAARRRRTADDPPATPEPSGLDPTRKTRRDGAVFQRLTPKPKPPPQTPPQAPQSAPPRQPHGHTTPSPFTLATAARARAYSKSPEPAARRAGASPSPRRICPSPSPRRRSPSPRKTHRRAAKKKVPQPQLQPQRPAAEAEYERDLEAALARPEGELVDALFAAVDADEDGYWNYAEAKLWGEITKGISMTPEEWASLCAAHEADPEQGLSRGAIEGSYSKGGTAAQHFALVLRYAEEQIAAAEEGGAPAAAEAAPAAAANRSEAAPAERQPSVRSAPEEDPLEASRRSLLRREESVRSMRSVLSGGKAPEREQEAEAELEVEAPYAGLVPDYDDDSASEDEDGVKFDAASPAQTGSQTAHTPYVLGTSGATDFSPDSIQFQDVTSPAQPDGSVAYPLMQSQSLSTRTFHESSEQTSPF